MAACSTATTNHHHPSPTTPATDPLMRPVTTAVGSTLTDTPPTPTLIPPAAGPTPHPAAATLSGGGDRVLAVKDVWQKNCDGLTVSEQDRLWQLLLEFKDCFSLSEDDVGRTGLIQHDIDTGDAPPIRMRPRRLPLARQEAADKALGEMQRAGLVEPSTSSWAGLTSCHGP